MAPTINSVNNTNTDKRPQRQFERKSELICRVKYGNNLPDIPFDLKYLQYPFDGHRFVEYNPTSLERNYKYEVLTEHDLGVTIDLINRDLYQADPYAQLDPADEKLLEEDSHTPHDSVRSRQHSRSVSWLRKSEYISTEQTRFQPQSLENIEAKVGYNVKKSLRGETLYLDRDAQIKAIKKTFADSKIELTKHYAKPNVLPVEILPVFPDYINWKYPCAQVIFDNDPAPAGKTSAEQLEVMSQAMIRGVMDESGEQFVAYFLPTDQTLEKRRLEATENLLYRDDEQYDYKIAREYNWNVKTKASKGYEENYFWVIRHDGIYFNELETRVRLNKRRVKFGQQANNTKLIVKHRPLDANEHRSQRYRERQLEAPGDEEDEEEEEMEVDEQTQQTDTATDQNAQDSQENSEQQANEIGEVDAEMNEDTAQATKDRQSRSRTRSGSRTSNSRSRTRSRSGSASGSGSRSSSRSRSPSRSRSRSRSRSGSGSRSGSHASSRRSKYASHTPSGSCSRSPTPAGGDATPRSGTRSRSRSLSRSRSASGSRSGSAASVSPTRSRSGSPSSSGSGSGSGSGSASEEE